MAGLDGGFWQKIRLDPPSGDLARFLHSRIRVDASVHRGNPELMLILALRETLLWPLLDWSGAVLDAATLVLRAPLPADVGGNPAAPTPLD